MQTKSVAQRLSDEVRAGMARHRITQERLAQKLQMSQPAVSRRLKGEVDFTVTELAAVAELLDTTVSELADAAGLRSAS